MKVGITGHKGFLGSNLFNNISGDDRIDFVQGFDVTDGDLLNPNDCERFVKDKDVIVHLAGLNRAEDSDIMKVNVVGTTVLTLAIKKVNPECRLIFASSFWVYGSSKKGDVIDEKFILDPKTIFGLSKKFCEEVLCSQLKNYANLRFSNVYGPGCRPFYNAVTATFVELAKQGKPIKIFGNGQQTKDFIFIEDVVSAILSFMFSDAIGNYNICSGESTSVNEMARILKSEFKDLEIEYENSNEKNTYSRGSYQKAKDTTGWEPKVKFEDGFKKSMGD